MVGHAEEVAGHRIGDGDHGVAHGLATGGDNLRQGQVGLQGGRQARIVSTRQHFNLADLAGGHFQGKTGIRAAYIGQQARTISIGGSGQCGEDGALMILSVSGTHGTPSLKDE